MKKYFLDDVARVIIIIALLPLIIAFNIVYNIKMKTRELENVEDEYF